MNAQLKKAAEFVVSMMNPLYKAGKFASRVSCQPDILTP